MRIELGNSYCLRTFLYGDAPSLVNHADDKDIARYLRDSFPHPYTIEHARAWIQYVKEHETETRFMIAYKDEAVGEIGFVKQMDVHRHSAEIGYWLSRQHWGQGVMSKALDQMTHYAFETFNLTRIYADVVQHNHGSCRVLEKCGFKLEGIFHKHIYKENQFYDQYVYGLVR